jgi:hypothetical protein
MSSENEGKTIKCKAAVCWEANKELCISKIINKKQLKK